MTKPRRLGGNGASLVEYRPHVIEREMLGEWLRLPALFHANESELTPPVAHNAVLPAKCIGQIDTGCLPHTVRVLAR